MEKDHHIITGGAPWQLLCHNLRWNLLTQSEHRQHVVHPSSPPPPTLISKLLMVTTVSPLSYFQFLSDIYRICNYRIPSSFFFPSQDRPPDWSPWRLRTPSPPPKTWRLELKRLVKPVTLHDSFYVIILGETLWHHLRIDRVLSRLLRESYDSYSTHTLFTREYVLIHTTYSLHLYNMRAHTHT